MQTELAKLSWTEIESYLTHNNSIIVPIGSTEQHGPTGMLGTDFLTADAIARAVGERINTLVCPALAFGVAPHHMAFAGTMTLTPTTFQTVVCELLESLFQHGFRNFYLVNGHGGNEPSLRSAFQTLKARGFEGATFQIYNWWKLPEVSALAEKHFGTHEGFHATPSELSVTYFLNKIASRKLTPEQRRDLETSFVRMKNKPWPLSATEIRQIFSTGAMGSDPDLATGALGEAFFGVAVEAIAKSVQAAPRLA